MKGLGFDYEFPLYLSLDGCISSNLSASIEYMLVDYGFGDFTRHDHLSATGVPKNRHCTVIRTELL